MASNVTRVERSGIEECIKKINGAIEQLNSAAKEVDNSMNDIANYWEGAAYDNARQTYDEEYRDLLTKTVPEAVGDFKSYIDQCLQKIQELDEQLAGRG